jgi:hypothetical protein
MEQELEQFWQEVERLRAGRQRAGLPSRLAWWPQRAYWTSVPLGALRPFRAFSTCRTPENEGSQHDE